MDWVDPRMAALLAESAGTPAVDLMALPIEEARAAYERRWVPWNAAPRAMREVRDCIIEGDHAVRARIYRPETEKAGTILYVHGGGWMFGSLESHDLLVRELATAAQATAVAIEYRLSPEHVFPAARDDVASAAAAILRGSMPGLQGPLALAGDSAGATLALSALLKLKGVAGVAGAALFYGCYDTDFDTPSYRQFGDGRFGLSLPRMQAFWRNYLGARPDLPADALPGRGDLEGLPGVYLHAAGLDVLMGDSLSLAEKLHAAGVGFELALSPGLIHGHLQMAARLEPARQVLSAAGAFLRRALDNGAREL